MHVWYGNRADFHTDVAGAATGEARDRRWPGRDRPAAGRRGRGNALTRLLRRAFPLSGLR
ncbi:hypothetical protein SAMN05216188_10842 [Lentzea xinjiangensis]|uniref:Uncharacterized protein n=1 Tax=Lentzea xinjiangensis TaxID=402600 RepID=A0A1H9LRG2_9PSEU|nr:hypothetical protein [Lentzea xinjiangensis]SER13463.1 hypothetical protein SAMN05216188_10842 [Lentzea xinjiangensis]